MPGHPHTAVKRELLVRYLDFWVPAALHSPRGASYFDSSGYGPAAAVRVVGEFADLLSGRHRLTMWLAGTLPADPGLAGLRLARLPEELAGAVAEHSRGPVLVHLDGPAPPEVYARLGAARDGELLLVTPPVPGDPRAELHGAGFALVAAVELVDAAGTAELVRFATPNPHSLERFKDELWSVDRYAGTRFRDPADPDGVPLEISLEPHPGPLRRALLAHLGETGPRTVGQLREYALARTLYRPADVHRALSPLLARGELAREPERGRLTGTTLVRLPG